MRLKAKIALAALLALAVPTSAADSVSGRWYTQERDAVILIGTCGKTVCGTIEKFIILPPQGNDQRDVNNPDPAKRSRRLLGMAILTGLVADGDVWRGKIYDPKNGKTYTAKLRRKRDGNLEMKGCVGPFCEAQVWKKVG